MDLDASRHQETDAEISELVTVTRQAPQLLISVAHLDYLLGEAHLVPGEEQFRTFELQYCRWFLLVGQNLTPPRCP